MTQYSKIIYSNKWQHIHPEILQITRVLYLKFKSKLEFGLFHRSRNYAGQHWDFIIAQEVSWVRRLGPRIMQWVTPRHFTWTERLSCNTIGAAN